MIPIPKTLATMIHLRKDDEEGRPHAACGAGGYVALTTVAMESDCGDCRAVFMLGPPGQTGCGVKPVLLPWAPEPLPNADDILADVAARKALMGPDHVREDVVFCEECECLHLAKDGVCEPELEPMISVPHPEPFHTETNGKVLP